MFDKLSELVKKYEDLSYKLSDPSVMADQNRYQQITREHSKLKEIVDIFQKYKKFKEELKENKKLLEEKNDEDIRQMAKEEIPVLEKTITECEDELKILLLPSDPNDSKNVILEIRAGTGGEEAALFAAELFRMYARYAERAHWQVEVIDQNFTGLGGLKEIVVLISGTNVYSKLKFESGTHRVQRVPETETQGRVHTSAVTVAVLPEADEVDVNINPADLRIDTYRASGAGGQHVNKTSSAVRITHIPTGVVVACQDDRSQHKNKARAMKVLSSKLLDIEIQKQASAESEARKAQVGSGDRSEKIRTYNFPQSRVTDHRIGYTMHNLPSFMNGEIDDIILALRTHYQTEALKEQKT
ncbi:MAG: peptide chain release factor 1 [Deltaproteobacteria bacterium CG11_big_fil_rev_8_21_14_0_20_42_23]|nr:MAG: peptide chain release factor 1 [Deltaproteobacteria bacterium CG11_big_fil_rev_8_21_14_0_20_42_23]PJC64945.1 MAG: peptide chain release factor 1 [Deltaproteobacteria bacterium CG_4_9_14_0_2_um_filter_42_21]